MFQESNLQIQLKLTPLKSGVVFIVGNSHFHEPFQTTDSKFISSFLQNERFFFNANSAFSQAILAQKLYKKYILLQQFSSVSLTTKNTQNDSDILKTVQMFRNVSRQLHLYLIFPYSFRNDPGQLQGAVLGKRCS